MPSPPLQPKTVVVRSTPEDNREVMFFFLGSSWQLKTMATDKRWMIKHSDDYVWRPLLHTTETEGSPKTRRLTYPHDLPLNAVDQAKLQLLTRRYRRPTPTFNEQYHTDTTHS